MLHGEECKRRPAPDPNLAVDVLDVMLGVSARDDELLCNLGIRETDGYEPEDLDLARAEPPWTQVVRARPRLARRLDHRGDALAVQRACAGVLN